MSYHKNSWRNNRISIVTKRWCKINDFSKVLLLNVLSQITNILTMTLLINRYIWHHWYFNKDIRLIRFPVYILNKQMVCINVNCHILRCHAKWYFDLAAECQSSFLVMTCLCRGRASISNQVITWSVPYIFFTWLMRYFCYYFWRTSLCLRFIDSTSLF